MKQIEYFKRICRFFMMVMALWVGVASCLALENAPAEEPESSEEMRRRLLTTVEAAKQYQDMMDEQLNSLKSENKDLHEKLIKLKGQFESVMSGVASNLKESLNQKAPPQGSESAPAPAPKEALIQHPSPHVSEPVPVKKPEVPEKQLRLETVKDVPSEPQQASRHPSRLTAALSDMKLMSGVVILGILILVWCFWGKSSKKRDLPEFKSSHKPTYSPRDPGQGAPKDLTIPTEQMVVPVVSNHQEGEYDYIGSPEAIPARLDLARMYKDMGNLAQAELVLKSVLAQGSQEQRLEAEKMLAELGKMPDSQE